MPRINIEPDLFTGKAFSDLVIKIGDSEKAVGALVYAFIVAQKYWVPEQDPIPNHIWKEENLNDALIGVFARQGSDGYYVRGSNEQFQWLIRARESGKKGGDTRVKNEKQKQGTLNQPLRELKEMQPSSSSSSSSSKNKNICPLVRIWNNYCGVLPRVRNPFGLSPSRQKRISRVLALHPDLNEWETVVKALAASSFCTGGSRGGWRANFDFLIKDGTFDKVLEGAYSSGTKTAIQEVNPEDLKQC